MRPGVWPSRSGGSGVGGGRGVAVSAVARPSCCPSAVCCCHCSTIYCSTIHCSTIHCCAIATPATITAVLHHQSRCDGRLTAIGMLSAVTLPDRPYRRCTARSGAPTISGCHPRQDPPRRTPPAKSAIEPISQSVGSAVLPVRPALHQRHAPSCPQSQRDPRTAPASCPATPAPALVCRQCRRRAVRSVPAFQ